MGLCVEIDQFGDESFFPYEDLPSNKHGAIFGQSLGARSNGKTLWENTLSLFGKEVKSRKLSEMLCNYLEELKPKNPEQAPNWSYMPQAPSNQSGSKNFFRSKRIPQNPNDAPAPVPGLRPPAPRKNP